MEALFQSPGKIMMLAFVIVCVLFSFAMLSIVFRIFRKKVDEQRVLFAQLGNETVFGNPGRLLMSLYIIAIIVASIVIAFLIMFQPHVL